MSTLALHSSYLCEFLFLKTSVCTSGLSWQAVPANRTNTTQTQLKTTILIERNITQHIHTHEERIRKYNHDTHTHEERIRKYNHDINEIMSNIPVSKHQHHINDDLCPMIFGQINLDQNITSISQLSTG